MGQLGLPELIIIGLIVLLIFGPKKLPQLGAGLGKTIRDFKAAMNETSSKQESEPSASKETEESEKNSEN